MFNSLVQLRHCVKCLGRALGVLAGENYWRGDRRRSIPAGAERGYEVRHQVRLGVRLLCSLGGVFQFSHRVRDLSGEGLASSSI